MIYKDDYSEAREKMKLWWNGKLDEPALNLFCPQNPDCMVGFNHWAFAERQKSPSQILDDFQIYIENNYFLGEQLPVLWINLGPGVQAAYYTDFLKYDSNTCWFEVNMEWEPVLKMNFLEQGFWWNYTKECFQKAGERNNGDFIIGMTDIGGVTDILASLRGTQNLLMDLMMEQDKIHIMQEKILDDWFRVYFDLDRIIGNSQKGKSAWMGIWCPEDWYPLQCDFSAMISPAMFLEFVMPQLDRQTRTFPYSIYHLDGPGQIPHLELLLTLDRLSGIQWVPGSGAPDYDSESWSPIYRKILDAGKLLVLSGVPFHKIETILNRIGTRNILITSYCTHKEDADQLIQKYKRA